jgi:OmpA-OmpF porin, OOP family
MKTSHRIAMACAAFLAAGSVFAAPPPRPWYLGASGGGVNSSASGSDLQQALVSRGYNVTSVQLDEPNTGWKVFGGFRFHPNWAAEVGYTDLGEVKTTVAATGVTDVNAIVQDALAAHDFSAQGWTADLVGMMPAGPTWLFAKAGLVRWNADIKVREVNTGINASRTENGTGAHWGVGIKVPVYRQRVNLRAEWERFDVSGEWIDFYSAGLEVRFGGL